MTPQQWQEAEAMTMGNYDKYDWVAAALSEEGDDWFGSFVESVVLRWRRAIKKEAAYKRNPTTKETGDAGEEMVAAKLRARGYQVEFTDRSQTPADLYAYRQRAGGVVHVVLIQVKSTEEGEPAKLSAPKRRVLSLWASRVYDEIRESRVVPEDVKESPLIVSCGWAGAHLDTEEIEGSFIMAFHSSLPEGKLRFLERFHEVF